jgi:excisionase family DNA binding protein
MLVGTFDMTEEKREWQAGDLLSIAQAAEHLDISRQRVHKLIQQQRIVGAYMVGEFWVIPFEALENIKPAQTGRPKKTPN